MMGVRISSDTRPGLNAHDDIMSRDQRVASSPLCMYGYRSSPYAALDERPLGLTFRLERDMKNMSDIIALAEDIRKHIPGQERNCGDTVGFHCGIGRAQAPLRFYCGDGDENAQGESALVASEGEADNIPLSSGRAGGRPVTSRISSSLSVSRESKASASASSCFRCAVSSSLACS